MRVAVSGSTGLVGSALVARLRASGHSVSRLVRRGSTQSEVERLITWNPERGTLDPASLQGHDAVVHLAGEPLFGLWTDAHKQRIKDSRVRGTALLARTIAALETPPSVFVTASAIGYYGNRPANEQLDEDASPGSGFLAEVVQAWENAAQPARLVTRIVNTRFGLVLTPKGGALKVMQPLFQAGLGGKLGSGSQTWSWVTLEDVVGALMHVIENESIRGPVNVTAPNPVSNQEFSRVLAHLMNRPAFVPAPAFAMRLVLREMADDMLLSGARVLPRKLLESGYEFRHPELEPALRQLLARR